MLREAARARGYVLAGGRSSRMGTNKAELPWRGRTLIEYVADEVRAAAGSVTIVGGDLDGFRSIPDSIHGCGPLGGIAAALADTDAEWNLIVACDMPGVTAEWLGRILNDAAEEAVIPITNDGRLHPLCAAWNQSALPAVRDSIDRGVHTVIKVVRALRYRTVAADDWTVANVNTPTQWESVARRQER